MASKRSVLEDLFLFRRKADVMYDDAYKVSSLALKIAAGITPILTERGAEKDMELLAKIYRLVDLVNDTTAHSNEYADSLINEYKRVMKGINKL
ncbi:hypothetical protein [Providencia sp. Me31A]|uniref:hypothetical protein n=1 Tax=Providencia sp. Me31A TaxID=3392637 RepID=UPI003D2C9A87